MILCLINHNQKSLRKYTKWKWIENMKINANNFPTDALMVFLKEEFINGKNS